MAVTIKKGGVMDDVSLYHFGNGSADGNAKMKDVLGGKGANLAEMASLGVPVPPGFTIPCSLSVAYEKSLTKGKLLSDLSIHIAAAMEKLQGPEGKYPLLSVRSGARVSMPGMMDTILNVGMTSETLEYWKGVLGERAALDCYRRLIQMYSSVAMGVPMELFESALEEIKESVGVKVDSDLTADHMDRLVVRYLAIVAAQGLAFPNTLPEQVMGAVEAVFKSWNNPRAVEYRKIHGYSDSWGTAVTVQAMVFGNLNDASATGVVFTRCPSTGNPEMEGEFLVNAQGEDVVAGIRTPDPIHTMEAWDSEAFAQLSALLAKLEEHYRDMQDVEFTVQDGKLYLLQTRNAKRSPKAAFRIAHDLATEGVISEEEAVARVNQAQLMALVSSAIDPKFNTAPHLVGIAAGGGVVSGKAVFSSEDAVNCKEPCILIRKETDPDDIAGMNASVGILTATGGLTSHAAVVARGMHKSCVVGATDMVVQNNSIAAIKKDGAFHVNISPGQKVTIDGATGNVWVGIDVPIVAGGMTEEALEVLNWATPPNSVTRLDMGDLDGGIFAAVEAVEGEVYVDTALFHTAEKMPDLEALGMALSAPTITKVYLDMKCLSDILDAPDRMFDFMFGKPPTNALSLKVKVIGEWPSEVRGKVVCLIPEGPGYSGVSGALKQRGMSTLGAISTVSDLFSADGPMTVSDAVIAGVFGDKDTYLKIKELVEASTGKKHSGTMPTPLYWYELLEGT